jgi:hypothetical protein
LDTRAGLVVVEWCKFSRLFGNHTPDIEPVQNPRTLRDYVNVKSDNLVAKGKETINGIRKLITCYYIK